ncbi:MAG: protein-L-isoaspartate(D-aspartate) O-methyltransferase [Candidatus Omnitrophota bacterium]
MNFETLRKEMVENQLIPRGIKNDLVLKAFSKVERHKFVKEELVNNSYDDYPLPIEEGQTISQPFMVALMTECLNPMNTDRILEIGTGSGYQTAILAEIAKEVYSVERFQKLAEKAQGVLSNLEYKNIHIKVGDGTLGWEEFAPYDGIIVTAASPDIPEPLISQLKDEGKLVIPLNSGFNQTLTIVEKDKENLKTTQICSCVFVPLVGKYGYTQ